jgi:hypothetical protein
MFLFFLGEGLQILFLIMCIVGARGSVVDWGTMLQTGRSQVRVPDEVDFFNLPNPSGRTRNEYQESSHLTAICEPSV